MQENADSKARQFTRGMLVAWLPMLVFTIPIGIQIVTLLSYRSRATGMGAVAGGFSEAFAIVGVVTMIVSQVTAIALLARSLAGHHPLRNIAATLSMLCSVLVFGMIALAMWAALFLRH